MRQIRNALMKFEKLKNDMVMKKWISFWVLMMVGVGAFAQKSYVNVIGRPMYASNRGTSLSGAVPKDMEKFYDNYQYEFGDVLNMLGQRGFVVEDMSVATDKDGILFEVAILSKSNAVDPSAVQKLKDDDAEVYEVARYNLQGMPVKETEKGIQIVVFSNYTTKTIIKE